MPRLYPIFILMVMLASCTKAGSSKTVSSDPISQFLEHFRTRAGSFIYSVGSTNGSATPEDVLAKLSREGAEAYPAVSNFQVIEIRAIHSDEQRLAGLTGTNNVVALVATERGRKLIHLKQDEGATNIWTGTNIWWHYHVYDSN